ncbi:hypothetical protein [Lysobacter capsici]|uniref:hypothetical protein n=1 Tax=Lysobacter capsici TaxID=435897 RepID=UPI0016517BEC|nr:hypothetical protein [Lysobacter capsici]
MDIAGDHPNRGGDMALNRTASGQNTFRFADIACRGIDLDQFFADLEIDPGQWRRRARA